jgi:hypothetical protein
VHEKRSQSGVIGEMIHRDYETVMHELRTQPYVIGIFSAAVADYQPDTAAPGKIPNLIKRKYSQEICDILCCKNIAHLTDYVNFDAHERIKRKTDVQESNSKKAWEKHDKRADHS